MHQAEKGQEMLSQSTVCLKIRRHRIAWPVWEAVNRSGKLNPAGPRNRPLSRSLGVGHYSLTTGRCRTYKIIISLGYIALGVFNQGRESDFYFGKEDSGPGSEQLWCQTQRRLWIGDPETGISGAWTKAAMPVAWSAAVGLGVSATHTAGWPERVVARVGPQGWLGGGTHFLPSSPSHLCAEGSGAERTGPGLSG